MQQAIHDATPRREEMIETPSGKGAGDENFPVGSWLLPAHLRPHVATFYRYARAIDDIADNHRLAADDKVARLERFAAAIRGEERDQPALATAHAMRVSLAATGIATRHCLDLIAAFEQDATKLRYADWGELMGYCALSANPVGRYLIDLHGESRRAYLASDALCSALQVLNHLQDCQDDFRNLDRVYLPLDWLGEAGLPIEVLNEVQAPLGLRRVLDRCLDGVDALLAQAAALPAQLGTRLALESAVILRLAQSLTGRLRVGDPLAGRVALTRGNFMAAGVGGIFAGLTRRRRAHAAKLGSERS